MKLAFLGTPAMAVPSLRALVAAGHDIDIVVTGADKRRGRGSELTASPVKAAALELGLAVSHSVDDLLGRDIELGVVVAFGHLIRPHVLAEVPMVNSHYSLLPRWRGAAPVERALLAGDAETGVCLMQLEAGLDTGPIYDTVRVTIDEDMSADDLRRTLVPVGVEQLVRCLGAPLPPPLEQRGEPLYAAKIHSSDLRIDWSQPAEYIDRLIRVGDAWTTFRGKRVKIHGGFVTEGRLQPIVVQPEGKAIMTIDDFNRGMRPLPGEFFE